MPDDVLIGSGQFTEALTPEEAAVPGRAADAVAPAEIAKSYQEQVDERLYGDAKNTALTLLEGGLSGLTFGGSDLVTSGVGSYEDDLAREARTRVNARARIVGELSGAVLPALFSGGTGALGTVSRLTPSGRLAAITGRVAGSGTTVGARLALGAGAGVVDGAATAAGNYIARTTIDADRELSAEGLLSAVRKGAIVGGLTGAGAIALGIAADRAVSRFGRREIALKRVAPATHDTASAHRGHLARVIDDARSRPVARELDDALQLAPDVQTAVKARPEFGALAKEHQEATAEAADWFRDFARSTDRIEKATPAQLAALDDVVTERGATALARLDDATKRVDSAIASMQPKKVPGASEQLLELGKEALSRVAGPVMAPVGVAVAAFTKARTALRAVRGLGAVPSTRVTRAAERVVEFRGALESAVRRAPLVVARSARGATKGAKIASFAKQRSEATIAALHEKDVGAVRAEALAAAEGAGVDVEALAADAAVRSHEYLRAHAPRSPNRGTPWEDRAPISDSELREFERRLSAVQDPLAAVRRIMSDPLADIEAETLRATSPAVWRNARDIVREESDALIRSRPDGMRVAIGRAFDLPLSSALLPGYAAPELVAGASAVLAAQEPAPTMGRPSASTTSPMVTGEEEDPKRRSHA